MNAKSPEDPGDDIASRYFKQFNNYKIEISFAKYLTIYFVWTWHLIMTRRFVYL